MFPSCRPSQSLWWHADELIHSKKSLRKCAFPKFIVHGLLSLEEHIFPSFGVGDSRTQSGNAALGTHRLCPTSSHSCLQVTPSACPTFSQGPSSCHSSQKDRLHRRHRPFICWISTLCHACRNPKQLDLGRNEEKQDSRLLLSEHPLCLSGTGFINRKKETICYWLVLVIHHPPALQPSGRPISTLSGGQKRL